MDTHMPSYGSLPGNILAQYAPPEEELPKQLQGLAGLQPRIPPGGTAGSPVSLGFEALKERLGLPSTDAQGTGGIEDVMRMAGQMSQQMTTGEGQAPGESTLGGRTLPETENDIRQAAFAGGQNPAVTMQQLLAVRQAYAKPKVDKLEQLKKYAEILKLIKPEKATGDERPASQDDIKTYKEYFAGDEVAQRALSTPGLTVGQLKGIVGMGNRILDRKTQVEAAIETGKAMGGFQAAIREGEKAKDAAAKKATLESSSKLPGWHIKPGVEMSDQELKDNRESYSTYSSMLKTVNELESQYLKHGPSITSLSKSGSTMAQLASELELRLSKLYSLGALSATDYERLKAMVPNPVGWSASTAGRVTGYIPAKIHQFKNSLRNTYESKLEATHDRDVPQSVGKYKAVQGGKP